MLGWDHSRRQHIVDLGNSPPITLGDEDASRYTRAGVSARWIFGAVVTAITSLALMGGALIAALDGRYVIAASAATVPTERVVAPRAAKGDKAARPEPEVDAVATRKVVPVNTVVREGNRDVITERPYVLVNASLVLEQDGIGDVPAFNARDLATREEPQVASTDAIYDRSVDGTITVSVTDFPLTGALGFQPEGAIIDDDDVMRQLRESSFDGALVASAEVNESFEPAVGIVPDNVSVVVENVSELVKTDSDEANNGGPELVELVQPNDTLGKILLGSGITATDTDAIANVLGRAGVATLRPGQILRIAFKLDETEEITLRRPSRLSIYDGQTHLATVAMTDGNEFVIGQRPPGPAPEVADEPKPVRAAGKRPTIYRSLYQTAMDQELPPAVRDSLLATFSLDVDFNAEVRPGDRLTVLHSDAEGGEGAEILYTALVAGGVERKFYRFKSSDGSVDFYDPDGRTGDKFLLRKPMARGIFRSGFGWRRHPILKRRRMHKGVDWAAPRGTPIYAAGDGVIKQAGWKAGYGRWILISHKNGYDTGYAHQSRLAKGMRPGVRVKQGQVIGYVGSTGFSTGPHLHYEVRVNGRHVNPLKIRLRRGRELSGEALVSFRAERERIDALLAEEITVASR